MYKRFLSCILPKLLAISPVVLLSGPRQVGKSTLSFELMDHRILLDGVGVRESAYHDPGLFIKSLKKLVCLDEIQIGIIFYLGDAVLPFGERCFALPMAMFF